MFTWYAAVIASFIVSLPFLVKTATSAMESVDQSLINASYTLGRSELYTLFHVVIPLSLRGIIAGATLAFARAMGEFGATLMVAGNIPGKTTTMPLTIYNETIYGSWTNALWMVMPSWAWRRSSSTSPTALPRRVGRLSPAGCPGASSHRIPRRSP